jgi:hypothetical protein
MDLDSISGKAKLGKIMEPPATVFHEGSGKVMNTVPPNDFSFYEMLNEIVQQEPATSLDPEQMGSVAAIGIIKGKPFAPDARMKKILTEALVVANATSRSLFMNPRDPSWFYYPGSAWMNFLFVTGYQFAPASQAHNRRPVAGSKSKPCGPSAGTSYCFDILSGSRASIARIRAGDAILMKNVCAAGSKIAQRVRPGTLISAIRSLRPMSTTDAVYESAIAGSPTLATTRRPRLSSNATPFGLTPTAILKPFRSLQGVNTETVFSPRLVAKTRSRASDTSAPATAGKPAIDSTYRSCAQSITSIESLAVWAT